jgi:hypothetical protein
MMDTWVKDLRQPEVVPGAGDATVVVLFGTVVSMAGNIMDVYRARYPSLQFSALEVRRESPSPSQMWGRYARLV